MKCPHCASELADGARFCPACGKPAVSTESSASSMPAADKDMAGREIAGRYRITKKLGEGGMGAVYRAEQISLKRQVAVKVLRPELSQNQQLVRRFDAEAQAVAKLNHPNIVGIYDNGQDTDGSLFIAMEYIEGRSLRAVVNHEAPLHPARALHIASQVAAALTEAHATSIIHRDLKPDNVMLQDRGKQKDVVRVLDFGIAKLRDDSRATQQAMTQAGDMLGTPQYMAPEQIKGEHVDGRTDIYALGCMIYEMITGRQPFEATTVMAMLSKHLMEGVVAPSQRRPDLGLSPELDRLVLSAMMKDAGARPPTMEIYGEQIAAVLATLPPDPGRPTAQASAQRSVVPVNAPTAASMYAPTPAPPMTPPGPQSWGPPPQHAVAAAPSQFPPSQLPTMMRSGRKRSKAPLWIALTLVVLGGGGVAAYFLTRPQPKVETDDPWNKDHPVDPEPAPAPAPTPEPAPTPKAPDPWDQPGGAAVPSRPKTVLAGKIQDVAQGVKLNVPNGFTWSHEGGGLIANNNRYLIAAGPLVSTKIAPTEIAQEYASANGLQFDGMSTETYAGAPRFVAKFHGSAKGVTIAQTIVGYGGSGYNVVVGLTVEYGERDSAATLRFARELFDKRVILP